MASTPPSENVPDTGLRANATTDVRPPHARSRERLSYVACFVAAVVFGGLTLRDVLRQRWAQERAMLVPVSASVLLAGRNGFLGDPRAQYTLVEFGDYECPPCRLAQKLVSTAMARYSGRIRLDFRQFPLRQIHPHGEEAAVAAESARANGKFWSLHARLFAADLAAPNAVARSLALAGVVRSRKVAQQNLAADAAIAARVGAAATPTFVLCCPDGRVLRLRSLQEIESILK